MSVDQALQDLENLEPTVRNYIIENLDELMQEFLIFEITSAALASNLPKEFVDGVAWVRTGELSGKIVNRWGSAEKPLARWFNDGTPDHWIEPLKPGGVLSWTATFGNNATAIFFAGNQTEGQRMYSKGHYVSGLEKTEAMQREPSKLFNCVSIPPLTNASGFLTRDLNLLISESSKLESASSNSGFTFSAASVTSCVATSCAAGVVVFVSCNSEIASLVPSLSLASMIISNDIISSTLLNCF